MPWSNPGELNLRKDKDKKRREEASEEKTRASESAADKASKVAQVSALEKELKALKRSLEEEGGASKPPPKKRKKTAGERPRRKREGTAPASPFNKGGLKDKDENEMGADWGTSED